MNEKEECELVNDFAIQFLKNELHGKSQEFVKQHLAKCEECSKYYKNIENKLSLEKIPEKDKDNIVINQFKKIHKHISILKTSLICIIIFIFIIGTFFYIKNQKIVNIINNSYSKIENMKELDNYKLIVKTIEKNLKTNDYMEYEKNYYYKDGKYKIESDDSIRYCEDNSYEKICVYNDLKQIDYYKQDFIEENKGRTFNIFSEVINYKKISSTFYNLALSLREERYNGVDCYVIRFGNENSYRDTWIDKNTYITIRVVNEDINSFYREDIYTFYEDVVRDIDVDTTVLNSSKYQDYIRKNITNSATDEIKLFYELYDKE